MAAKYDGIKWSKIGELKNPRYGHRSITTGNSIMHIGGNGEQ